MILLSTDTVLGGNQTNNLQYSSCGHKPPRPTGQSIKYNLTRGLCSDTTSSKNGVEKQSLFYTGVSYK